MPNEVELVRRSDLVEVLPEPVRFAIPAVLAEAGAIAGGAPGRLLACHTRHHSGALAANAAGHVQATETWTVLHGGVAPKAWRGRAQKMAAAGVGALLAIVDVLGKVGVQ
jgi:hypothetical protein